MHNIPNFIPYTLNLIIFLTSINLESYFYFQNKMTYSYAQEVEELSL